MKSFVKGIWSRTKKEPEARALDHPANLLIGDMIQLSDSFGLPSRLRDQTFKVIGISTYQFEHQFSTSFSLEGLNQDFIDLTINKDGGRETAAFSLSIDRSIVEQIFDLDEFSCIFDGEDPAQLSPCNTLDMEAWLADSYHQESRGERGFFYESDYRASRPPAFEDSGEPFDYYYLESGNGQHGIEIEVYDGGETEVSLTLYRPIEDIKELWPASTKDSKS